MLYLFHAQTKILIYVHQHQIQSSLKSASPRKVAPSTSPLPTIEDKQNLGPKGIYLHGDVGMLFFVFVFVFVFVFHQPSYVISLAGVQNGII